MACTSKTLMEPFQICNSFLTIDKLLQSRTLSDLNWVILLEIIIQYFHFLFSFMLMNVSLLLKEINCYSYSKDCVFSTLKLLQKKKKQFFF